MDHAQPEAGMTNENPVEVFSARDLVEAYFVRDLLIDAGIEAIVVGDPLGMAVGDIPPIVASPRIWVPSSDTNEARQLTDEYQRRRLNAITRESAYCYHCGEPVTQGRSDCPACGQELEWDSTN